MRSKLDLPAPFRPNTPILAPGKKDSEISKARITKLLGYEGLKQVELNDAGAGDIVTVAIFENASASKEATTETDRSSSMSAGITSALSLEKKISRLFGVSDPTALVNASTQNDFSGGGKTERKENLVATLTTQIVERLIK